MPTKKKTYYFSLMIFLALTVFGAVKLWNDNNVSADLKQQIVTQSDDHPVATFFFVKSLDELTPSRHFLGFDWPGFGWLHLLLTLLLISISSFVMDLLKLHKGIQLFIFIGLVLIGYILGTVLLYVIYTLSAEILQIDYQSALLFRQTYNNGFNKISTPLILISGFTLVKIIEKIFQKVKA